MNSKSDDNPIAIIVQGGDRIFFFEILKRVINEDFKIDTLLNKANVC